MAKIISFQIPKSQREFVRFQEDRGWHFYDRLHQHPQLQLTVILEGRGQFLSRDYVGRFQPGDVFFLGENAPHVFRSDPAYFEENSDMISAGNTVFFDFQALGNALGEVEDLQSLKKFTEMKSSCFQIFGESNEKISEILRVFGDSSGLGRFQLGIQLLSLIENAGKEMKPLNQVGVLPELSEKDGNRMNQVMQFIFENCFGAISLEEAAATANMSKEAFCRFFKLRTRKTFTQYINQLRISEAQKLLEETDLGIAEIAFRVGFENLSYFNRSFRRVTGKTPREFRG
ncbi:AraC family transcriptional regulator [Algoriphagus sp. CAU 1675]|uniref:AraC family transcriptional regulator n=1 Tax=Algoriphagus sp. CAU 1675 TaxID=3032597 RepID=UPI0023DBB20A|nr:AraC family transcriptional regulator [Algoriphagus sp. CAU 1675]MDF2158860.1 AraC family transcriptional regulator [Algoriphagus sp. CAU 1675]